MGPEEYRNQQHRVQDCANSTKPHTSRFELEEDEVDCSLRLTIVGEAGIKKNVLFLPQYGASRGVKGQDSNNRSIYPTTDPSYGIGSRRYLGGLVSPERHEVGWRYVDNGKGMPGA